MLVYFLPHAQCVALVGTTEEDLVAAQFQSGREHDEKKNGRPGACRAAATCENRTNALAREWNEAMDVA